MEAFEIIGRVDEFPDGEQRLVQVGTQPVLVLHRGQEWIAFDDYCPHRAGPLSEGERDSDSITCPWHGAKFDIHSGKPISGPCNRSLRMHPIHVQDGNVSISLN